MARIDLKADRANSSLVVRAAHLESPADPVNVVPALHAELQAWAGWLGLSAITVERRGGLSAALQRQVRRHGNPGVLA